MAEGILGLGSSGSTGLNQELIDKLKEAESEARVKPIEDDLEEWDKELEKIAEIESKVTELLGFVEEFDLFKSGAHAFEQVSASTTGSAAVFNAVDVSGLTPGASTVSISQLAQRDVYQSSVFSDKDVQIAGGNDSGDKISIQIDGTTYDFTTVGKTYQELADDINANTKITASVEQVGDSNFRLVIKSTESGTQNKLTISQTGVSLGIDAQQKSTAVASTSVQIAGGNDAGDKITINGVDFSTEGKTYQDLANDINANADFNGSIVNGQLVITRTDGTDVNITQTGVDLGFSSAILNAQNMKAQVDGVDYDVSSNTITIQGNLTMTAVELGTSSISIQQDTSTVIPTLQSMITAYNELVDLIDEELFASDSVISDPSSLRTMMASIKDQLFGSYGADGDQNIFNYGFDLDRTGHMTLDTEVFAKALSENFDNLKDMFIGTAEKPGLGTQLKEYLDGLDGFEGLLTQYGESLADRKTRLESDKEKAQEELDSKYSLMAEQFASYTAIITQLEASFGGLKLMIEQSTAG